MKKKFLFFIGIFLFAALTHVNNAYTQEHEWRDIAKPVLAGGVAGACAASGFVICSVLKKINAVHFPLSLLQAGIVCSATPIFFMYVTNPGIKRDSSFKKQCIQKGLALTAGILCGIAGTVFLTHKKVKLAEFLLQKARKISWMIDLGMSADATKHEIATFVYANLFVTSVAAALWPFT